MMKLLTSLIKKTLNFQIWKLFFLFSFINFFYVFEFYSHIWRLMIFDLGLLIYCNYKKNKNRVLYNEDLIPYYAPASVIFVIPKWVYDPNAKYWVYGIYGHEIVGPDYYWVAAVIVIFLKILQILTAIPRYKIKDIKKDWALNIISAITFVLTLMSYRLL